MRLIIITGIVTDPAGKATRLDLDTSKLQQQNPEVEIAKNAYPDDGVAILDCDHVATVKRDWANDKPLQLGECPNVPKDLLTKKITEGDYYMAALDYINQGLEDQPPEEEFTGVAKE